MKDSTFLSRVKVSSMSFLLSEYFVSYYLKYKRGIWKRDESENIFVIPTICTMYSQWKYCAICTVHKTIQVKGSVIVDKSHGWIPKWVDEYVWCLVRFCNRESGFHSRFGCFQGQWHFPKWLTPMPYEVFWSLDCTLIQLKGVAIWSWMSSCRSRMDGLLEQGRSSQTCLLVSCTE